VQPVSAEERLMSLLRQAPSRLREERGIALVLSLMVLTVFGMVLSTLIYYTTSNTTATSRQRADQQAFALAEAGLNDAMSMLVSDASNPDAVPATSTAATLPGATYTGSRSGDRWTLTGRGTVRNPSAGTGTPLTRQVTQKVDIVYVPETEIWSYLFSDATGPGCMRIKQNGGIDAPLYVRGNLCVENNAVITRSPLQVEGTLDIANNGAVGSLSAPLEVAKLRGGCTGGNPDPHPCTSADDVYARSITTTTDGLTKPSVDFAAWYQKASPGPNHYCTSGSMPGGFDSVGSTVMDGSRPTFDLTPGSAYSCSTSAGQISWVPGNPGTLTVSGVIFFDGNVVMNNNANALYSGRATLYANGSVVFNNGAKLCAIAGCTSSWNTTQNVLMVVAGASTGYGFHMTQNSEYQGAAYTVADYRLENNARNWGPVVANQLWIDNNAEQMKPLLELPPGAPGTTPTLRLVADSYSG
jgi:hypothetical protein